MKSDTFIHAVQKMQRALYEFHIRGVKTNISFLEKVLRHEEFLSGAATTSFIDRQAVMQRLLPQPVIPALSPILATTPTFFFATQAHKAVLLLMAAVVFRPSLVWCSQRQGYSSMACQWLCRHPELMTVKVPGAGGIPDSAKVRTRPMWP